jgi:hypothetical protein
VTTAEIREAVYVRQGGCCIQCGKYLTRGQFHLHEKVWRSRGGKISLKNSEGLCYYCHIEVTHGRTPKFSKKTLDMGLGSGTMPSTKENA